VLKRGDEVGAKELGQDVYQEVGGCKESVCRGNDRGAPGAEVVERRIGGALVVEAEEGATQGTFVRKGGLVKVA
jgi:hypothetical protein